MPKKNPMLERIEMTYRLKYRLLFERRIDWILQLAQDTAMITANEVLGLGKGRSRRFAEAYIENIKDAVMMIKDDQDEDKFFDYAKGTIDGRLAKVCGDEFVPWEQRYNSVGLQHIKEQE